MALLPQDPRNQRLVLLGIAALGIGGVYQQMYWSPKNDELNVVEAHVMALDSLNAKQKLEVAKGNAVQMRAEADSFARQLKVLRRLVPTENEVAGLLESASNAARRAGLEISNVAPEGVVQGDNFDVYKYRMGVTGPFHQVAQFLTNVGSLQRIVQPMNLSLVPTSRTGERRPRRDEQFLDAQFQVQTYVAKSTPTPPPAPAGKPGGP